MTKKALVIKFDGIDGCGKTSLLESVKAVFLSEGYRVLSTKEFGSELDSVTSPGTAVKLVGPHLREIALSPEFGLDDIERELLFAVISRRTNRIAIPRAAQCAELVLVDRSNLGNMAYGVESDARLRFVFESFVQPLEDADVVFFIDTAVEECRRRIAARGAADIIESKGLKFFEAVADNYRALAHANPSIQVLEGSMALDELSKIVCSYLRGRLPRSSTIPTSG